MGRQIGTLKSTQELAREATLYEIGVKGHLDQVWSEWFEGTSSTATEEEASIGPVGG